MDSPPFSKAADYSSLAGGQGRGAGGAAGTGRGADAAAGAGRGVAPVGRGGPAVANRAIETRGFATLPEYGAATKQDQHSVLLDYDVFVNVARLDAQDRSRIQKVYKGEDLDFALRAGSAAVDRGMKLPTVTDGFTGSAPDLGALEVGRPAPQYGPRQ